VKTMLRTFNQSGLAAFVAHLNEVRTSRQWESFDELLFDSSLTNVISSREVDLPDSFASRLECGMFFVELFDSLSDELEAAQIDPHTHVGLWAWLSAAMGTFLKGSSKEPFIGESSRWLYMPNDFGRYYRHLLAGPYMLIEMHRDDPSLVAILLYNEVTKPNTAYVEQIASRPLLVDNSSAMRLIHEMYFDYSKNRPKTLISTGVSVEAGDIRRFGVVFNQLDLTWDVAGMSTSELAAILPKEFASRLPAST